MEASRNDPGAGMRQGRGPNERSGEQHDREHTPAQTIVQSTRRIAEHTGPTKSIKPTAPLRIVIEPTTSGRKWTAGFNDRVLCRSALPFVMSARVLLAEGYPADAVVEMWRPNIRKWGLRGQVAHLSYKVSIGHFPNGDLAEVSISNHRSNSSADVAARACGIFISLLLQQGCDVSAISHALSRNCDGSATGVAAAVLDKILGPSHSAT